MVLLMMLRFVGFYPVRGFRVWESVSFLVFLAFV